MNSEEARACFDRAIDGELSEAEQRAFQQALAQDASLRREFEELETVVKATRALASAPVQHVDLLGGVQSRLRERSGGRFYKDRFAENAGRGFVTAWLLIAAAVVLVLGVAWAAFHFGVLGAGPTR